MRLFLLVFFLAGSCDVYSQSQFKLAEKHISKVNGQKYPAKKLALYRKYFKKDSIKNVKQMEHYRKSKSDSLANANIAYENALKKKEEKIKDGVNSKIYQTVYKPWAKKQAAEHLENIHVVEFPAAVNFRIIIGDYLEWYFLGATQNDSMLFILTQQFPDAPMPKQLTAKFNTYKILNADKIATSKGQVLGEANNIISLSEVNGMKAKASEVSRELNKYSKAISDTESAKELAENEGTKLASDYAAKSSGFSNVNSVKGQFAEAEKLKALPGQYKSQIEQLQDSAYIKEQAKQKVEELAMQYLAENPAVMQGVQRKMSLLMKKYSVVPNSNDLSTATKLSSLKGKTFFERLQIATNFQVISLKPVSIDFSPQIGYKFNRFFVVGIGGLYRKTFSDSLATIAADVFGYKGFTSYQVTNSFFAFGEYGRNSPGIKVTEGKTKRLWESTLLAGIGRKFSISPKFETTLMFGYNFLHKNGDTVYPKPWVIRVGFQTSELAMMKRK